APSAASTSTQPSESWPRAAWIPQTIAAVSLGRIGNTASPRQMPNSSGYVHAEAVSRSISPLRIASTLTRTLPQRSRPTEARTEREQPEDDGPDHDRQPADVRLRLEDVRQQRR